MVLADYGEWVFARGGGDSEGFNDAALDTFQGHRVQSMVREVIQNSADARADQSIPTKLAFSFLNLPADSAAEITSLAPWLKRAWDAEPPGPSETDDVVNQRHDFYRSGLTLLGQPEIPVLAIHDYNTTGLTGPTSFQAGQETGAWWALVRSTGKNKKNSATAGGSYGHGSKAPIAFSQIRSVFYYTEFVEDDAICRRFQGKSILESMAHPQTGDQFTSNTGYFGTGDAEHNPQPLLNDLIPEWVVTDRAKYGSGSGTSVLIPLPQFHSVNDFWTQVKTALVANFCPALLDAQLVIQLGTDETVSQESALQVFENIDQGPLDDDTRDRLESAETVLRGARRSTEFPDIGKVDYFFRSGDSVRGCRVGIARSLGMLITRRIDGLGARAKYGGTEPFDLFIWVKGDAGNRLLRSLENPAHDAFEFDRVKDTTKNEEARKRFSSLRKSIRILINEHFGIKIEDRLLLGDLDFLLADFATGDNDAAEQDAGDIPAIAPVQSPVSPGKSGPKKKASGASAKRGGRKPPRGVSGTLDADGSLVERNELVAEGFRIVPDSTHPSRATIHIDVPRPEYRFLAIYKAGETVVDDTPCSLKTTHSPGKMTAHIPLPEAGKKARISLSVDFENPIDLHGGSRLVGVLQ